MGCLQTKSKQKISKKYFINQNYGSYNEKWKQSLLYQNHIKKINLITSSKQVPQHPVFLQIQKDIKRTFPYEKYFQQEHNLQQFTQTLKCFALSFPKIGYTQGMNFIAGYLLLNNLQKEQTLQILSQLFLHPSMLLMGLYEDNFPLTYLYIDLFWIILQKQDNQLYKHLKQINIPDTMWIFQWFLTFFIYSFPMQYIQYFLTYIFEHKQFSILKISLAIILVLRQDILKIQAQQYLFIIFMENLKIFNITNQILTIPNIIKKTQKITNQIIKSSLQHIKNNSISINFYIKYFNSNQQQQKTLYQMFINEIQYQNLAVSLTNNTNLMQSYKRNSNNVNILDQILQQSIKRQNNNKKNKRITSNIPPIILQTPQFTKSQLQKPWKSQFIFDHNSQIIKQDQTNFSIVKKIDINNSKISIFQNYYHNSQLNKNKSLSKQL